MSQDNRIFSENTDGHVDLIKAREGGLFLGFFTGYPTDDELVTRKMVTQWLEFVNNPVNHIRRIKTINDLDTFYLDWKNQLKPEREIGTILHFEGAAGIDEKLELLKIYYDIGLRSMSLTWNEENHFATGVKGTKDRGLTELGVDLISTMQDMGIIVDVSHLNDKSFWDVIEHTDKPIIASHSNLRDPANTPRNLTDDMVTAIADTGGSIGINFCKGFLSEDQEKHPANRGCAKWMINRVIELVGSEHVHIGSDFDGCTTPESIPDISIMTTLFDELSENLKPQEMDGLKHGNILRIIRENWIK